LSLSHLGCVPVSGSQKFFIFFIFPEWNPQGAPEGLRRALYREIFPPSLPFV